MSPRELLKQVFSLQEERVKTYKVFDNGFKTYLQTAPNYDFPTYRKLVHDVTQKFNDVSCRVREIQKNLKECGQCRLEGLIREIQLKEKEKLELTARLQIAEQNAVRDPEDADTIAGIKMSLQKLVDSIVELLDELKYEAEDILLENT